MHRAGAHNAWIRNDEFRRLFLAEQRKACSAQSYARALAEIKRKHAPDLEAIAAQDRSAANLEAASR